MKKLQIQHEVEQFLYRQAACLDGKQWQEWIDLFAPDGIYWMPSGVKRSIQSCQLLLSSRSACL